MRLKINKLNNNGVGISTFEKEKVFVPFSLPEEEIEAAISYKNSKFTRASIIKIINPSKDRVSAPCPYFTKCGGCSLQHMSQELYYNFKNNLLKSTLLKVGFYFSNPTILFISKGKRRRITLKAELINNELFLGFYQYNSKKIISINSCIVSDSEINALFYDLREVLKDFNKIIICKNTLEIMITSCSNGLDILFKSRHNIGKNEEKILLQIANKHNIARMTWKENENYKVFYLSKDPVAIFNDVKVKIPYNTFLQATNESEKYMIDFVLKYSKNFAKIIDLFAGIGTFSIPMSEYSFVSSVEGNLNMSLALKNFSPNLVTKAIDLFKNPIKVHELNKYDLAVINPPRSGAILQTKEIAKSKISSVILISCNLDSFIEDIKVLKQAGFKLKDIAAVDQFVYTHYLEVFTYLTRD